MTPEQLDAILERGLTSNPDARLINLRGTVDGDVEITANAVRVRQVNATAVTVLTAAGTTYTFTRDSIVDASVITLPGDPDYQEPF